MMLEALVESGEVSRKSVDAGAKFVRDLEDGNLLMETLTNHDSKYQGERELRDFRSYRGFLGSPAVRLMSVVLEAEDARGRN